MAALYRWTRPKKMRSAQNKVELRRTPASPRQALGVSSQSSWRLHGLGSRGCVALRHVEIGTLPRNLVKRFASSTAVVEQVFVC